MTSGSHKDATNSKSDKENYTDRYTRKRTGNVIPDLACKGRERQKNPNVQETKIKFENCQVCGKSYRKGRGLSIHMSLTTCRSVLERRNRNKCKSINSSPQETNHSGSTKQNNLPRQCSPTAHGVSMKKESEKLLETNPVDDLTGKDVNKSERDPTREEDILVINDEIEEF